MHGSSCAVFSMHKAKLHPCPMAPYDVGTTNTLLLYLLFICSVNMVNVTYGLCVLLSYMNADKEIMREMLLSATN